MFTDIVNQDAFTQLSLTAAITKGEFTPQQLATSGLWQEAGTLSVTALIEELEEIAGQAAVKPRGAPGAVPARDRGAGETRCATGRAARAGGRPPAPRRDGGD